MDRCVAGRSAVEVEVEVGRIDPALALVVVRMDKDPKALVACILRNSAVVEEHVVARTDLKVLPRVGQCRNFRRLLPMRHRNRVQWPHSSHHLQLLTRDTDSKPAIAVEGPWMSKKVRCILRIDLRTFCSGDLPACDRSSVLQLLIWSAGPVTYLIASNQYIPSFHHSNSTAQQHQEGKRRKKTHHVY